MLGFTSRLSLSNLDLSSSDAAWFVEQLNYGQQCLLQDLTRLCSGSGACDHYENASNKSTALLSTSGSTKEKIGKLFHFNSANKRSAIRGTYSASPSCKVLGDLKRRK